MNGMLAALSFLTPFGRARTPTPAALPWFPVVGAAIGAALGVVWLLADHIWPPLVAAVVLVAADLAVTGLLHVDGLADTADGVLPPLDPSRRLAVMATPDVGAFGVAVVALALVARVAAVAVLAPSVWLLVALWALSRTAMVAVVVAVPYVGGGLAAAFQPPSGRPHPAPAAAAVTGVAVALLASALWRPVHGPIAVGAAALTAALVAWGSRRRLGGYTGDVLGAGGVGAETVGLLVAAASI